MPPRFTTCGSGELTHSRYLSTHSRYLVSSTLTISIRRRGGHLYICGKISMAEGVETALRRVLATSGSLDTAAVDIKLVDMRIPEGYLWLIEYVNVV